MGSHKQLVSGDVEHLDLDTSACRSDSGRGSRESRISREWNRLLGRILPKMGKSSLTQKRVLVELLCWSGVALIFSVTPLPRLIGNFLTGWVAPPRSSSVLLGVLLMALLVLATWSVRCWLELGKKAILSETDPLTGLYNRRHFRSLLMMEISRVRRHSRPLSLIMFDVDDFKSINDSFGHAAGDQVLTVISDLVDGMLRDQDCVARWGGDEFVILAPETDLLGAFQLAERLRHRVCKHDFETLGRVTASFGVARVEYQDDVDSFLGRVDRLLYLAKERGKNVVQTEPINLVARAAMSRQAQLLA